MAFEWLFLILIAAGFVDAMSGMCGRITNLKVGMFLEMFTIIGALVVVSAGIRTQWWLADENGGAGGCEGDSGRGRS